MFEVDGNTLEDVLNRVRDGVCAVGPDGRVLFWNRAAEHILGYPSREVLGRPCREVFAGRDGHDDKPVQHIDMRARTKDGQPVWLDMSFVTLPRTKSRSGNGHGNDNVVLHVFRDVTATATNGTADLTRRELEVLRLIAEGARTRAVAERLHLSPATVRNHVQNIFSKLTAHNRLEAVAYATRHRLL